MVSMKVSAHLDSITGEAIKRKECFFKLKFIARFNQILVLCGYSRSFELDQRKLKKKH